MSLRNFILLLAAAFGFAWLFGVIIPFFKMRDLPPIALDPELDEAEGFFYPKRGGRIANGARVYAENGCYLCHTQLARPTYAGNDMHRTDLAGLAGDPERGDTRRETNADDFYGEAFAHIGSTRIGPDLSNVGRRFELAAQVSGDFDIAGKFYAHLYDPRLKRENANALCPSHKYLFEARKVKGQTPLDALPFDAPEGSVLVPGEDARSLVSYLMSLKKDHTPPAALAFPVAGEKKDPAP